MVNAFGFLSYVFVRKAMNFNLGVSVGFTGVIFGCSYLGLVLSNVLPRFRRLMGVLAD